MSQTTIDHRRAQPYVAISARIESEAEFRQAADEGFPRLFGWLRTRAVAPAGPPFIRYRAFNAAGEPVHIEIGVPVANVLEGDEGIDAEMLPAGEWLTYLHRGPYAHATEPDLRAARKSMRAWADEHGIAIAREDFAEDETPPAGCIEQYRIGPHEQSDYTRWQTELAYLVHREPADHRSSDAPSR